VVLVVALWTLVILARPLVAWKVGLVAAMAGTACVVLAVPPLAEGVLLLALSPVVLVIGSTVGVSAAVLVELAGRVRTGAPDVARPRSGTSAPAPAMPGRP
jgi:cation-transporting P-type ATPase E